MLCPGHPLPRYKNQLVKAVEGNDRYFFWDP